MTEKRFEGSFVLAPAGSGKTTALLYLIMSDLAYVEQGKASVIVMDDKGDFLRNLQSLETFHTGALKDKLIIIEPDLERPMPLNPFAISRQRMQTYNRNERQEYATAAIDIISHIFATIGEEAKFTPRQRTLFRHCVRLCLEVPDATFSTLDTIFTTKSIEPYRQYVQRLEPTSADFFENKFKTEAKGGGPFQEACTECMWRTAGVREDVFLDAMLNTSSSLDLSAELNAGKFIIINTNRNRLGDKVSVLGRVIIALIRLAMRERDPIHEQKRMPTYFYIDEAHHYLDHDDQIASMLDDVRASRLGMTFATQRLSKFKDPNVKDALLSCGIQLARPTPEDAMTVARYMETHHETLRGLPKRNFYLYVRGEQKAQAITIPEFSMRQFRHVDPDWVQEKQRTQPIALIAPPTDPDIIDAEYEVIDDDIRPSSTL